MSNTYKKYPRGYFRSPRGKRKAIINGARKGSIPPDDYDDINVSKESRKPFDIVYKLLKENLSKEFVIHKICKKFKLSYMQVEEIINVFLKNKL